MKKSIKKLTTKAIDNTKAVKGGNGRPSKRKKKKAAKPSWR